MPTTYLPDEHHVVRYVPWARLRKDENDNVIGVLGAAFRLREDEEYLSATWAEFSEGERPECIVSAVKIIRASALQVTTRSGFAVGNVGRVKAVCLSDQKRHRIRVSHEAEDDNRAHVALRGWPRDNEPLLDLLAEDAWSEIVLNKDIPAA
jgi:hypothetical protein